MINCQQVTKKLGDKQILQGVSFEASAGAVIGLVGPNGAGKTTMIRVMNGVINPTSGTIFINGLSTVQHGNDIRAMSGVVSESAGLYSEMSARDNLLFFAGLHGVKEPKKRITQLIDQFDLGEYIDKPVDGFSTGMKKRVAIAKALLHQPKLLFLDEPTNGLDPDGIKDMIRYLKVLNEQSDTTIIICSHLLQQLEHVCHSFLFMEQGKVVEHGTLEQLSDRYIKRTLVHIQTGASADHPKLSSKYKARSIGQNTLEIELRSKDELQQLLPLLLELSWVHGVRIVGQELEDIYYEVRRRNHAN